MLELDHKFIAAHHQPAVLIDVMLAISGVENPDRECHQLLAGTGLFLGDIVQGEAEISPRQFNKLLANSRRLYPHDDLRFLLGKRLLPGPFPLYSNLIRQSRNLRQLLTNLARYYRVFSPLLYPHIEESQRHCYIRWSPAFAAPNDCQFMVEMMQTALATLTQQLSERAYPWSFHFRHSAPPYMEQYWINLNSEDIQFSSCADMMVIAKEFLDQDFPVYSETSYQIALHAINKSETLIPDAHGVQPFLTQLQHYIQAQLTQQVTLESAAEYFRCSASTFKRKLSKHKTSFQQQLDSIRHQQATKLIAEQGWNNQQVAEYLNFSDSKNFRRAFKRWSGITPAGVRLRQLKT